MAKKAKRRSGKRVSWTRTHMAELRRYSKDKLPVKKISSLMKRTVGALRQKARTLGIDSAIVVKQEIGYLHDVGGPLRPR